MEIAEGESGSEWDKYKSARNQVSEGCRLVRDLETKLNAIASEDMYEVLLSSSAEIVATFSRALDILNYNWKQRHDEDERRIKCSWNSSSVCPSPTLTPRSGGRSSLSGSGSGSPPTPTLSDYMSPHATLAPKLKEESPENEPLSLTGNNKERREISRKRKPLPRKTIRVLANNSEPGNDTPPDDGHTWRKYGQKDILGAQHPRSYYRCTHKNDRGCQATKQVQRTDDDPSSFEITYRGDHTCQIDRRVLQIQLPYPFGTSTNSNSATSNTLVFGTDCDLQAHTSTGHGFAPTKLHASSSYTPTAWFVGNACKVENETSSSFSKSQGASTMFPPLHNLLQMEETSAPDMVQSPNRTEKICVSSFRNQGDNDQGENSTEIIPPQQNTGFSAFPEEGLGWPNFGQIFSSPATSESNYISVPTPAMPFINTTTCGHQLQPAESDLTDVVSGHTSAADSPMLDIDPFTMFSTVNLDSYFQFERSDPF